MRIMTIMINGIRTAISDLISIIRRGDLIGGDGIIATTRVIGTGGPHLSIPIIHTILIT